MLKDHGQKSNLHTIITTLQEKARNRRNNLPKGKKRPATDKNLKVEAIGDISRNFCPLLHGANRPTMMVGPGWPLAEHHYYL
jgi:hypothetical protein